MMIHFAPDDPIWLGDPTARIPPERLAELKAILLKIELANRKTPPLPPTCRPLTIIPRWKPTGNFEWLKTERGYKNG